MGTNKVDKSLVSLLSKEFLKLGLRMEYLEIRPCGNRPDYFVDVKLKGTLRQILEKLESD